MEGAFNTFRMGTRYSKLLTPGDTVLLFDTKDLTVLGAATVMSVELGSLQEMLEKYAALNHTWIARGNPDLQPEGELYRIMKGLYGPHIAQLHKKTTVISLERTFTQFNGKWI
jgi:hypothetical protein